MTRNKINIMYIFILMLAMLTSCGEPDNGGNGGEGNAVVPRISITGVDRLEGNNTNTQFEFEVTLSASTTAIVSVDYETQDGTARAGEDYLSQSGTLVFEPGDIIETISIEVIGDLDEEEMEQFIVKLSNAENGTLSTSDAIGGITNDEGIVGDPTDGYVTPLEYEGFEIFWQEEFTGNNINPNFFTHEFGDHGWGNNELQDYGDDPKNSFVEDGCLVIEALQESDGSYTSARIITRDKVEFTFGRVDIRAKVPGTQGIWPALWMLGSDFNVVGWPTCGEIDIMELVGHDHGRVHGTAHYGTQGSGFSIHKGDDIALPSGETFADEFHVFSIIWEQNSIKWLMDDQEFHSLTPSDIGNEIWRFNHDFFFIFNVAVGGNWPGFPDATTVTPAQMKIDYIRVFQEE